MFDSNMFVKDGMVTLYSFWSPAEDLSSHEVWLATRHVYTLLVKWEGVAFELRSAPVDGRNFDAYDADMLTLLPWQYAEPARILYSHFNVFVRTYRACKVSKNASTRDAASKIIALGYMESMIVFYWRLHRFILFEASTAVFPTSSLTIKFIQRHHAEIQATYVDQNASIAVLDTYASYIFIGLRFDKDLNPAERKQIFRLNSMTIGESKCCIVLTTNSSPDYIVDWVAWAENNDDCKQLIGIDLTPDASLRKLCSITHMGFARTEPFLGKRLFSKAAELTATMDLELRDANDDKKSWRAIVHDAADKDYNMDTWSTPVEYTLFDFEAVTEPVPTKLAFKDAAQNNEDDEGELCCTLACLQNC